ncbi:MAG: hypothetical protein GYA58_03285 [Anaerolineaceae bacterium]|nr:hypothetical protein [Anaerolineaceae bacterium]
MAANPTPLKITLYNDDNEVVAEYTRLFVPWRMLKVAIRLMKTTDLDNLTEEAVDELAAFVSEVFGGQITVDQLNDYVDISEMATVLRTVVAKAHGAMGNPLPPAR